MLRNRVLSSLIALGAVSLFSLSALAQGTKPGFVSPGEKGAKVAPQRDAKGRFIKADAKKEEPQKPGAARDAKGRFVKAGGEKSATAGAPKMAAGAPKMAAGASKMAAGASKMAAGKPVWNAKANRWQGPDGKFMKEADALKAGGKK